MRQRPPPEYYIELWALEQQMMEAEAKREGSQGPPVVECDGDCGAPLEPQTDDEVRAAYNHWRFHGLYAGCSHGC